MRILFPTLLIIGLTILPSIAKTQDKSLVLYFSFDNEAKKEVEDNSQYGNNGTLTGDPKWTDGKFGKALMFDAVDDSVIVPTSNSLEIEEEITLMAWAKPGENLTADWRTIVGKATDSRLAALDFSYDIRTDNSGKLRFSLNVGGWQSVMGPLLKEGDWYHIAGTWDGKEMILYLSGVPIGRGQADGKIIVAESSFCVGNIVDAGGASRNEYWSGIIDEVRIWNKALSEEQVKKNMEWGKEQLIKAVNPQEKLTITWGALKATY